VLRALTPVIKQSEPEADYSPPPSAEVKNAWSCTSTPPICLYVVVRGRVIITWALKKYSKIVHGNELLDSIKGGEFLD
jgi:hypothetical protein